VQTIRQPDGTEIQVLKQPGGSGNIMKQLKQSTTKQPMPPPMPMSVMLPKDPLAMAMETIKPGEQVNRQIRERQKDMLLARVILLQTKMCRR
jgi:hypothetical protein